MFENPVSGGLGSADMSYHKESSVDNNRSMLIKEESDYQAMGDGSRSVDSETYQIM